jgi:phenylpropionate dioxygenase-like ring-hydroxylating dioxygenase large terminal subunit
MAPDDAGLHINRDEPPLKKRRRELARAAVEHSRRGTTAEAPTVMKEDVSFYTDPELFAREHQKLFRETPLVVCLSSELAEPGSYRTFDDVGVPIVVMRGKDGKLRGFLNICPHRGSRLVRAECGKASRFTCRFHAWTFDTEGKAIAIPDEKQFCGDIDEMKHLLPVPCEERHGLVFVQAKAGATMDLDAHLGRFGRELAILELENAVPAMTGAVSTTGNWKYTLDTFFETYHLNALHGDTFKGLFSQLCVFDTFGPHHIYTFTPFKIHDWKNMPEAEWPVDSLPLQYFLFPNVVMSVGSVTKTGLTVTLHRIFPNGVGGMTNQIKFCAFGGVRSPEHQKDMEASFEKIMIAGRDEDFSVTSESWAGFASLPPGTQLPIGQLEIGVQNFHKNMHQIMDAK